MVLLLGCASAKMYDKTHRTDRLRQLYPPGETSLEDVHKKIQSAPNISETRPKDGWDHHKNTSFAKKLQDLEDKNRKEILSFEKYMLPDPKSSFDFLSLCNVWFCYSANDLIVDVEWEFQSD